MKVLYIAPLFDGTGYSQAAIDYILALDAVKIDVVPRPIRLNGQFNKVPNRINELLKKDSSGCDIVIQHTLPNQFDYNGRFEQNIGLFASETSDFKTSGWATKLNCMDKVICINRQMVEACETSGVRKPCFIVPHAVDITKFQRSYKILDSLKEHKEQDTFLFYSIGEMTRRKNYGALLKAFHLEFEPEEPVELILKLNIPGKSPEETVSAAKQHSEKIRKGLKLFRTHYKEEIIIADRLSDEDIMKLHNTADCFVQPSYGEAWSIPAFMAMAMGKTPIVTRCTGYIDYLSDDEGYLVDNHKEPVFGVENTFEDLYVGTELWSNVDISHLRKQMRLAYENKSLRQQKSIAGIERAYNFSYEVVGKYLKGVLDGSQKSALDRTSG